MFLVLREAYRWMCWWPGISALLPNTSVNLANLVTFLTSQSLSFSTDKVIAVILTPTCCCKDLCDDVHQRPCTCLAPGWCTLGPSWLWTWTLKWGEKYVGRKNMEGGGKQNNFIFEHKQFHSLPILGITAEARRKRRIPILAQSAFSLGLRLSIL